MDDQITIDEWLSELEKEVLKVDIRGIADDPYCPKCGRFLDDFENPCSCCKAKLDWTRWEKINSEYIRR